MLKKLAKWNPKLARQIKEHIVALRKGEISWETLKVLTRYKKIRVRDYRILYKLGGDVIFIVIIDKRETTYSQLEHLDKSSSQFY